MSGGAARRSKSGQSCDLEHIANWCRARIDELIPTIPLRRRNARCDGIKIELAKMLADEELGDLIPELQLNHHTGANETIALLTKCIRKLRLLTSTGVGEGTPKSQKPSAIGRPQLAAPMQFEKGDMVFFSDRVELCGVVICSSKRSRSKRVVLELLSERRAGSFVPYSGDDLESKAKQKGAKGTAGRWIWDIRNDIREALRNEANIDSGNKDVILSGGLGYRFAECVSVQFRAPPSITDIREMEGGSDVHNGDVRNVRDDEAKKRRAWILQQLSAGVRLKAPQVVDQFKRSTKTAQRDLDKLRDEGKIGFVGAPRTGFYQLCKPPRTAE